MVAGTSPVLGCASQLSVSAPPPPAGKKLGLALVGLGGYARRVGDGLEQSAYWNLTGLVTGSPEKVPEWRKKWPIEERNVFDYESFDRIASSPDIDAVYICLPNSMHADFTIRAAKAGKHVICEKPMATSVAEAEQMIAACSAAGVKLAIGYRLHFNPYHQQIMQWGREKAFGKIGFVNATFTINVGEPGQWRLDKALSGGGPMMDVGIYCVQAARYATGEEPTVVTAQLGPVTDQKKFDQVEESISWQMTFPSGAYMTGLAAFKHYVDELRIGAADGSYELGPAFSYGPLSGGVRGKPEGKLDLPNHHHQQQQMEGMGPLFLSPDPLPNHISGEEGLKDVKILMAIYEAARSGRPVSL